MTVISKLVVTLVANCVGLVGGTVVATLVIAIINYLADDGPYFSPLLIGFGFLALPVGLLLLPIQLLGVGSETIAKRALGKIWLSIGVIGGLAAGTIWYLVESSHFNFWLLLLNCGFAVFQSLFGIWMHWIAETVHS